MSTAAYQIVCITSHDARLYGELVQRVADRQICWIRPLVLQPRLKSSDGSTLLDVHNGPDIICADHLPTPVIDTDWIQLLAVMAEQTSACNFPEANQQLKGFLECLFDKRR